MKSSLYQKRIRQYRRNLSRIPGHGQTVDCCLTQLGKTGNVSVVDEVFFHTLAPAMVEYVKWVLLEARKNQIQRLYFVARDGYMMYRTAQIMTQAWNLKMDLRYLKVSRHAIRSAEYYFCGEKALDTICVGGIDITFAKMMKRANLTEEEARQIARLCSMEEEYDRPLSYRQIQELKEKLRKLPLLQSHIREHAKNSYIQAVEYLKHQGMMEEISYALVDSGWIGTLQLSLQRVISHAMEKPVKLIGYYFGIFTIPEGTGTGQYRAFYFEPKDIRRKSLFSNCMFEAIFSAPEGMTVGYRDKEAIESDRNNPNAGAITWLAEELDKYTKEYLRQVPVREEKGSAAGKRVIRMLRRLLVPLMAFPTKEEAEEFGKLLFCDDVLELQVQPLAARWSVEELQNQRLLSKILIKANRKKGILRESAWPEGSMTNLAAHPGNYIRQEHWYRYLMYLRKAVGK